MFAPETTAFVEAGPALIVGTVGTDGAPHATRGWGLTVLDRGIGELRLLLDADDDQARANLVETGAIAITATDVPTLRSMQMKGTCTEVAPATDLDMERSARYRDAFFTDIEAIERVGELFDQTPGPAAGTPMQRAGPH